MGRYRSRMESLRGLSEIIERGSMSKEIVRKMKETDDYLHNPGMGILYIQRGRNKIRYDAIPPKAWFLQERLTDKIIVDIPWSMLEPKEGVYEWNHPDWEGCFNSWIAAGFKVAIEVRGMSSLGTLYDDGVPQWVFDAGAKYIDEPLEYYKKSRETRKSEFKEKAIRYPVYWDPVYLDKVNNLVHVLGSRYNNNPDIEFVMNGFMGRWGEMHISEHTPVEPWLEAGLSAPVYAEALKKIIDMYIDAFPNKPIVQELGHPSHNNFQGNFVHSYISIREIHEAISYLVSKGVWLKENGLGSSWGIESTKDPYIDNWVIEYFDAYYPKVKVMFENLVPLEALKSALKSHISYWNRGCEVEGLMEMKVGSEGNRKIIHYYSDNPPAMSIEEEKNLWRHMARHIGYRFVLKELRYPEEVKTGEQFTIRYQWENKGSAPCYKDYGILLALTDANDYIVWEDAQLPGIATSSLLWDAGRSVEYALSWTIPQKVKSGAYNLHVGMRDMKDPNTKIELAIAGKDAQKRYRVGTMRISQGDKNV